VDDARARLGIPRHRVVPPLEPRRSRTSRHLRACWPRVLSRTRARAGEQLRYQALRRRSRGGTSHRGSRAPSSRRLEHREQSFARRWAGRRRCRGSRPIWPGVRDRNEVPRSTAQGPEASSRECRLGQKQARCPLGQCRRVRARRSPRTPRRQGLGGRGNGARRLATDSADLDSIIGRRALHSPRADGTNDPIDYRPRMLMLPYADNNPTRSSEPCVGVPIAALIRLDFFSPPVSVLLRPAPVFRAAMPEAAIYEHSNACTSERDVGSAPQTGKQSMHPEAKPAPMQK
jgi:hypothetical protein